MSLLTKTVFLPVNLTLFFMRIAAAALFVLVSYPHKAWWSELQKRGEKLMNSAKQQLPLLQQQSNESQSKQQTQENGAKAQNWEKEREELLSQVKKLKQQLDTANHVAKTFEQKYKEALSSSTEQQTNNGKHKEGKSHKKKKGLNFVPPPPPPPSPADSPVVSSGILSDKKQHKRTHFSSPSPSSPSNTTPTTDSTEEVNESQLREEVRKLIEDEDVGVVGEKADELTDNWMHAFQQDFGTLNKIVREYPFMIRTHAVQPISAFNKIKLWEDLLFSGMPEDEAQELRKRKSVEITKFTEEEISEEVEKYKKTIEQREIREEQEGNKVAHMSAYGNVLEEIRTIGMKKAQEKQAAIREQLEQKMETGEIDLEASPLPAH